MESPVRSKTLQWMKSIKVFTVTRDLILCLQMSPVNVNLTGAKKMPIASFAKGKSVMLLKVMPLARTQ